jgi:hypothetical protein
MIKKIVFFLLFSALVLGCSSGGGDLKMNRAKEISNIIISNLDKESVASYFPEDFFSNNDVLTVVENMRSCGWGHRKGGLVKNYNLLTDGNPQTVFVYEYDLPNCDSLKVTLVFDLDKEVPTLRNVRFDPV